MLTFHASTAATLPWWAKGFPQDGLDLVPKGPEMKEVEWGGLGLAHMAGCQGLPAEELSTTHPTTSSVLKYKG